MEAAVTFNAAGNGNAAARVAAGGHRDPPFQRQVTAPRGAFITAASGERFSPGPRRGGAGPSSLFPPSPSRRGSAAGTNPGLRPCPGACSSSTAVPAHHLGSGSLKSPGPEAPSLCRKQPSEAPSVGFLSPFRTRFVAFWVLSSFFFLPSCQIPDLANVKWSA